MTENDIKRILVNPIYAITGMIDTELAVQAQSLAVKEMGAEPFIRGMIDSLQGMFAYDKERGTISLTIQLDAQGQALWNKRSFQ